MGSVVACEFQPAVPGDLDVSLTDLIVAPVLLASNVWSAAVK